MLAMIGCQDTTSRIAEFCVIDFPKFPFRQKFYHGVWVFTLSGYILITFLPLCVSQMGAS